MKTNSLTIAPILGCLKAASGFIKKPLTCTPVNDDQQEFIKRFMGLIGGLDSLTKELVSIADADVQVINRFLKEKGFDIQLPPAPAGSFSVASVLNILVEWLKEGIVTQVRNYNSGMLHDAVKLKEGVQLYRSFKDEPIVCIRTKSGDIVWITIVRDIPETRFGIMEVIKDAEVVMDAGFVAADRDHEGVIFPMIDYNQFVDISWIEHMRVTDDWYIDKALQQTKFRMNEKGARAESAVAMTLRLCCCAPQNRSPVIINDTFVLWIERPGVEFPVFAGVFAEDVWNKPANLD